MAEQTPSTEQPSALDQVNVRRLTNHIKDSLESFAFEPTDDETREQMRSTVEALMADIEKRGAVRGYEVGPMRETYHGWKELYPKLGQRIMAWIGVKVLRLPYSDKQRWYHTVFPFTIDYQPFVFENYFNLHAEDDAEGGWTIKFKMAPEEGRWTDGCIGVSYSASLRRPYTTHDMDLTITPVQPVKFITLNMEITHAAVQFPEISDHDARPAGSDALRGDQHEDRP